MDTRFQRILSLVKRTGDRVVVTDPNGDDAFVVMGLDQYEDLIDSFDYLNTDFEGEEGSEEEDIDLGEEVEDEPVEDLPEDFFAPEPEKVVEPQIPADFPAETPAAQASESQNKRRPDIWDVMQEAGGSSQTWDVNAASAEEQQRMAKTYQSLQRPPSGITEPEIEDLAKTGVKDDDESEEDQFYLEPVE